MVFRPSLTECARYFDVSEDTITRRIHESTGLTFSEYREKHTLGLKYRLLEKAYSMAMSGNVPLMIFCLKNKCGWQENPQYTEDDEITSLEFVGVD